jgi:thioredoxin-related protein
VRRHRFYIIIIPVFLLAIAGAVDAGDRSPRWRPFNDGLAEAEKSGKKVLVDVYTDWCGWCKRMDREVYAEAKVLDYLNKRFVVVKLNAEANESVHYADRIISNIDLVRAFGVRGYPATLFMKSDGEPITLLPGYRPPDQFIQILEFIGEDHYLTMKWEEYTAGKK